MSRRMYLPSNWILSAASYMRLSASLSVVSGASEARRWWKFFVEIPDDVKKRLAIAHAAHGIASQLAPLEPDANREILRQAAELLGVKE